MKWLWALGGFIALVVMVYSCALPGDLPAGLDRDGGLAGTYTVNGVDPTGVEYGGTVVITDDAEVDTYRFEWIVTGAIHEGTGVARGGEVTVEWSTVTSAGGTGQGTASYVVDEAGVLRGTRTIDGFDTPGTEELFPEQ